MPVAARWISLAVAQFEILPDNHRGILTHMCLPDNLSKLRNAVGFFHGAFRFKFPTALPVVWLLYFQFCIRIGLVFFLIFICSVLFCLFLCSYYEDYLSISFPFGSYTQIFIAPDMAISSSTFGASMSIFSSQVLFDEKVIDQVCLLEEINIIL